MINEQCESFHYPLLAVRRKNTGELKLEDSLLSLSPQTVVLSAIKESEDAKAAIVRWWNPTPHEVSANLSLHLPIEKATLAKLIETETAALPSSQKQIIETGCCGITTVRVEL